MRLNKTEKQIINEQVQGSFLTDSNLEQKDERKEWREQEKKVYACAFFVCLCIAYVHGVIFATLYFIRNLRVGPLSKSICPWQAYPYKHIVTWSFQVIMNACVCAC
jgi:hypothetical protein